ncbi:MAG: PKD domain-containing protein, partial [Thermoplasmata archaeon]|nr:PKD domain-containing protein [Thermoplasmata archaeon]
MGEENGVSVGRWAGKRALSTPTAAVIMIVVILVVGGLGYVGLNSSGAKSETKSTCVPALSPACVAATAAHDVTLAVPYKSVQQGSVVPYTASLPNGETATSFTFDFGDNATVTQASPSTSHIYTVPGSYIASATATVRGATHDSYLNLIPILVTASFGAASAGNVPAVSGTIVTNTTPVTGIPATAILQTGDSVTVKGTYTSAPTNPLFTLNVPTVVGPAGITPTAPASTNTSAWATFAFSQAG